MRLDGWDPPRLARSARRALRRQRRLVGAALVGLAALLALTELRPAPPPTTTVVRAARDLPAATRLGAGDVDVTALPRSAVPPAALRSSAEALGEVLAGPVLAGEVLTPARLSGPALLHGQPEGTVALPLRLADAAAVALLRPGDRIDVVAATPEASTAAVVGEDLPVLAAPSAPTDEATLSSDSSLLGDVGLDGGVVVVAASTSQVRSLVAAAAQAPLWFAVRGADTP